MKPVKWWMRLLTPFAKCQSKPINKQIIDCADIRVRPYNGEWYICHGPVVYCTLEEALNLLSSAKIYKVRLLLSSIKNASEERLADLETMLKSKYPEFKFYCGRDCGTWKKIIELEDLEVVQLVGSMQSWYGKLFPKLWNKLNKKKICNEFIDQLIDGSTNISLDFI